MVHISYGVYLKKSLAPPRLGDGAGTALITMDTAFGGMPDAVWLSRVLPNAKIAARSSNREVQARLCALGRGDAVPPRPLGDAIPEIVRINFGEDPPGRDTFVGYHRDLKRLAAACPAGARHRADRVMRLLPATPARAQVLNRRRTIAQAAARSSRC